MAKGEKKRYPELAAALGAVLATYKNRCGKRAGSNITLARRVGEELLAPGVVSDDTVGTWFLGQDPGFLRGIALCKILEIDPLNILERVIEERRRMAVGAIPEATPGLVTESERGEARRRRRGHHRPSG